MTAHRDGRPELDELIGADAPDDEVERLAQVHRLLRATAARDRRDEAFPVDEDVRGGAGPPPTGNG